jgi:hypothetical protein
VNHSTHAHNVNEIIEKIVMLMTGMLGHEIGMPRVNELAPLKTC